MRLGVRVVTGRPSGVPGLVVSVGQAGLAASARVVATLLVAGAGRLGLSRVRVVPLAWVVPKKLRCAEAELGPHAPAAPAWAG